MKTMRPAAALRFALIAALASLPRPAVPCTVFCISDGTSAFGGNNEDMLFDSDTRMWVVPAEGPGNHGRVLFGYSDGFPQGGVNDAGLFFDGLALDFETIPDTPDRPQVPGNFAERILAECTTVAEAIALTEKYSRKSLERGQLLFGDRTGDGVIFEGNATIRKQGRSLIATNFRQSKTPPAAATCERYKLASKILAGEGPPSLELCRRALSAIHQEGNVWTLYSNVYDLKAGKIHLYHFHDFDHEVVLDVKEELAKGPHSAAISSFFPESYAFVELRRQAERDVMARREKLADRSADPALFAAHAGRYRVEDGPANGMEIRIVLEAGKLYAELPIQGKFLLTPRGGSTFVAVTKTGDAEIAFVKGPEGGGMMVKYQGLDFRLTKLDAPPPAKGEAAARSF
jgi:hypothetical protein